MKDLHRFLDYTIQITINYLIIECNIALLYIVHFIMQI